MERLAVSDASWLMIEGRETPMHVAGLQLFELPEDAGPTFVQDLVERARASSTVTSPFDLRLDRPYGLAGQFGWVPDDDVDLDYHIRHSSLPKPGRIRELLALVSRLHSTLLDRHRPLWEVHLIEGLEDGRIALYVKFHHSMFDGVGAMQQALVAYSEDPDVRDLPAPWATLVEEPDANGDRAQDPFGSVMRAIRGPLKQSRAALGAGTTLAKQVVAGLRGTEGEIAPYAAPRSILNGPITGARRFAADDWELSRLKDVAGSHGVTLNDLVLSISGRALRYYLADLDALPDKPLIATVPVSIRAEGDGNRGNALSMALADLATDEADPITALGRTKASMDAAKARLGAMSQRELIDYAIFLMAPVIAGNLTGQAGRMPPPFNLVMSNVPGPRNPLYWNGARMTGMYAASLMPDGQALNITTTSYVDQFAFSLTACRKTLPQIQRMLEHIDQSIQDLEAAA